MRRINFHFKVDTPSLEALVFFALALDEQLYDLTDDSYKAPALNTFTRTLELQSIADANHHAGISKDALQPFIDELEWSIAHDHALSVEQKALCRVHVENMFARGGGLDRVARGVSGLRIVLGDYFRSIQATVLDLIENSPQKKQALFDLAAAFIIQAELLGYPRRHTYHVAQIVLIQALKYEGTPDATKLLRAFFDRFSEDDAQYTCLFLSDGPVDKYPDVLKKYRIAVDSSAPSWGNLNSQQKAFLASKSPTQRFVLISGIPSKSPAMAHELATEIFAEYAAVVRHHEHSLVFSISSLSLVLNEASKSTYMLHDAPDPMHCWVGSVRPAQADIIALTDVIHGNHLYRDSAMRLRRAILLHRTALQSNSPENQLIDLWAALEGLLPSPGRESLRIEYFSESVLPSLTLTYPEKLFTSAYRDVLKVTPKVASIVGSVPVGKTNFSKFVRLVLSPEFSAEREAAIDVMKANPLLLNKVWKLSVAFKSRTATQNTLRAHRQKVKWHLARIYFTRNSIMHSATSLPHLRTLVENLHFYVDSLVRAIARVAETSPETLSVEGALQYMASWERYRLSSITAADGADNSAPLGSDDVWPVVFGREVALAPSQTKEIEIAV